MLTASTGRPAAARRLRSARLALLLCACAVLPGCYLMQAARGQWQVLRRRVPIERVLADPHTAMPLRRSLENARAARDFAVGELRLPDNRSYRSFADIGRPYVVWNVVATAEFSVQPQRWCFPVAGCVSYRGYFSERRAREFAAALASGGADVVVQGVPAYSTLGRFADPVLSSMLPYGDDELAATLFHELAHQLLYVSNDSQFNEAFATVVEGEGLKRWLEGQGAALRLAEWRRSEAREAAFLKLFRRARARLARLYAGSDPPPAMREHKAQVFAALEHDMRELQRSHGVRIPLYEEWLSSGLNNAHLAALSTYYDCVPGFERLLVQADDDLPRFYAAARALARAPRAQRHAQLCRDPGGADSADGADAP